MKPFLIQFIVVMQVFECVGMRGTGYKCVHGKHSGNQPQHSRMLEVLHPATNYTSWHNIRFGIIWDPITRYKEANPSRGSHVQLIVRTVLGAGIYFQNILQVDYYDEIDFTGGDCGGPRLLAVRGKYDLVLVVHPAQREDDNYLVSSTPCYYSKKDGRPVIAAMWINPVYMVDTPMNQLKVFSSILHEFVHTLGFTYDLFENFRIPGTNTSRGLSGVVESCFLGGLN